MKKIINQPSGVVREMCSGLVLAHPELALIPKYKVIHRKHLNPEKVSLISGGGSGHEPAHAGFVGTGMLDAAVCGDVFASPSQIQVFQAIKATAGHKGTLLIIKNYSGDMMNFKNASFLAQEDGITVDYVRVDDDIAVQDSLYTVGRRGVAGTVLVHKIAGAAAERGWNLPQVKEAAQKAASSVRSIGFALTSCTVPAKGSPTFSLAEDEMEYGVGIHGEPGIRREKVRTARALAEDMVAALLADLKLSPVEKDLVVLINGFGATPLQELYLLNHEVSRILLSGGLRIVRTLVGNYMTSIDMAGASLSLMKTDDMLQELLSDMCDTPALKIHGPAPVLTEPVEEDAGVRETAVYTNETHPDWAVIRNGQISLENLIWMVDQMSACIIRNEVPFCELDAHAGDGDFGMSVAKGFRQLKHEWPGLMAQHTTSVGDFLQACSMIIMEHCGGASGPIWGSAFRAAGRYAGSLTSLTPTEFAELLQAVVRGIQATGERSFGRGAGLGDKTLMDALIPFADAWSAGASAGTALSVLAADAARAAVAGAEATCSIAARMGRAGTVGERSIGFPDAGAHALGVIFTEIAGLLKF